MMALLIVTNTAQQFFSVNMFYIITKQN